MAKKSQKLLYVTMTGRRRLLLVSFPKLRSVRSSLCIAHKGVGVGVRDRDSMATSLLLITGAGLIRVATFLYIEENAICVRQFTSTESHGNAQWLSRTTLDSALKTHNYCIHLKKRRRPYLAMIHVVITPDVQ